MNQPSTDNQAVSGQAPQTMLMHLGRVADVLFALAMAQNFLILQEPEAARSLANQEIINFLWSQLQPLSAYAVAFIVVGFYWFEHTKRFKFYKRENELHIWLQLLYLMGMFLIPYSNTLTMYFSENTIVKIWFSINTAFIGFLAAISWLYATQNHRLIDSSLDQKTINSIFYYALIEPIFSFLTIGVVFINPSWWDYIWFLLPIPYILIDKFIQPN
ncbi:TMEM175 family protein [Thermocoleostomius sinensis]|uniref:TMEM175 family protein n=1 Tax=Thermocoleostomius sinensis A174 TaxID=2016057 RepID=A0A9E8ZNL2_9CYAN|nr:TMEM175 family protein [Thermocoleostomius sinensis]WAL61856.1 TMEM175 family protein [Thermocoleostomius sinensis A174]